MLEEKILFEIGLLLANWVFNPFLTDPLSLTQVGAVWGDPKAAGSGMSPAQGFALRGCLEQGGSQEQPQNNSPLKSGMSLNLAAFVGLLHFMCLLINIVAC